ncbi:LacI family DNA-binding transcriptional regulator [Microtetraspora sp. AC03309]|uniref:LacI family DNA-binding transcriptional regulator n=1 Tax=Microtetraspora sp. AC03309 TaxID=2779376 RepID=UPI001E6448E8|nr:LacI family DNA-binding transcriptional regulator [Microtetraspora sp. AC03309]MCC5575373.1 LacI family DNA-binding transcriptional regulator [Microtetraspora sp. AC03309]
MRPARIQDVAQRAGVSWKTVSNVLHERANVRPETRARVLAAIEELNYRPSVAGRQLRMGRANLLALAVPAIGNPYFSELAHVMIEGAARSGYTVLIDETHGETGREGVVAEGFRVRVIDGIIFSPLEMTGPQLAARRDRTPIVLIGEHVTSEESGLDHVAIDNVASAAEATRHLLETGRERIGFLGHQSWRPRGTGDLRLQGYEQALAAAGLPLDRALILPAAAYSREEGDARVAEFLARLPGRDTTDQHVSGHDAPVLDVPGRDAPGRDTPGRDALGLDTLGRNALGLDALVCANDLLAIGAMRALRRAGIRVPEDVAVLGWDDTPEGAFSHPALTTVAPDKKELARLAVEALLRRIDGDTSPPVTYVVPHRLVVRESTLPRYGTE